MAYYGEKPWHGLGQKIPARADAAKMIQAAGLNWLVEKRPARGVPVDRNGRASRYEIVRKPRSCEEQEILLGLVSERYEPLQNACAFEFFDPVVGENKACFETAGALGCGERIWVLARLPDPIVVVHGDECDKYLLLSNTHDGKGSVNAKFTSVRVVCQNTLILAMKDGQQVFRVRHSRNMNERLSQVADLMALTREVYEESAKLFRQMAEIRLVSASLDGYLEAVFPRTPKQKRDGGCPDRWQHVMDLFESTKDLPTARIRGTLWAAYNAITQFEDYKQPQKEETQDERLDRAWFGSSAAVKLRALEKAREVAEQN
jgi:phage/plasmid-like protein (TIGR03299 family)